MAVAEEGRVASVRLCRLCHQNPPVRRTGPVSASAGKTDRIQEQAQVVARVFRTAASVTIVTQATFFARRLEQSFQPAVPARRRMVPRRDRPKSAQDRRYWQGSREGALSATDESR